MAPPSPNTTRGHLWEIAPIPILQLLHWFELPASVTTILSPHRVYRVVLISPSLPQALTVVTVRDFVVLIRQLCERLLSGSSVAAVRAVGHADG